MTSAYTAYGDPLTGPADKTPLFGHRPPYHPSTDDQKRLDEEGTTSA